ncbi:hypothetical protein BDQ12DRAFT_683643 [Crucibulum laeve]|uniref:Uncharacterized protein n=1 Tax=Crucibulum laeve TaxID=68775 RepID=A0A5C3LZW3_9AGAR|nr:hypothetical protein BDQ12DRAFT_683643 [Crucibulum laeve]
MRLQHNISPPAPGRGGSRKRKRGTEDRGSPVPSMAGSASGFSTFKVEPHTPVALDEDQQHQADYFARHPPANGRHRSRSPRAGSPSNQTPDDDEGYTSSSSDTLPAHLLPHLEPSTGLVLGRSQSMVMYLLMKAKHEYAITQHEQLCEELKVVRSELRLEKEKKEEALDTLLRNVFGAEAEKLIEPIPPPPSMMEVVEPAGEPSSASASISMTNGHGR